MWEIQHFVLLFYITYLNEKLIFVVVRFIPLSKKIILNCNIMKKIIFVIFIIPCSLIIANAQWQPNMKLTDYAADSFASYNDARYVAGTRDFGHVVWTDHRDGINNIEIYHKLSTNGGITWGYDTRMTNNSAYSEFPSISLSGLTVF
jgi:hypothetical protein